MTRRNGKAAKTVTAEIAELRGLSVRQLVVRYDAVFGADPLFVSNPHAGADSLVGTNDDDFGDVRLRPGSPAIDAGDNDAKIPVPGTGDQLL